MAIDSMEVLGLLHGKDLQMTTRMRRPAHLLAYGK